MTKSQYLRKLQSLHMSDADYETKQKAIVALEAKYSVSDAKQKALDQFNASAPDISDIKGH